ncbi:MAG: hypothetical protein QNI86_09585 [Halieaceae bacterium]|nr:hypothetical protein [Halieaceae bacterium]
MFYTDGMEQSRYYKRTWRWQQVISVLLVTALIGCTNMHPVELQRPGPQQVALPAEVQVGDVLRVRDSSGQVTKFKLTEIGDETLRGTRWDNQRTPVEVPLASIETMEVRRADARSNTKWVWGIILFLMASTAATPG